MTILVVDDEYYSVASMIQKLEAHYGSTAQILAAYNRQQALELFKKQPIDIMICDIEMPGGSGLDLLTDVRALGSDVINIYLTAYDRFEYISRAMKLSSMEYLLKPVDSEALFAALKKAESQLHLREKAKMSQLYLMDSFWQDLVHGILPSFSGSLKDDLRQRNLDVHTLDTDYLPVLLQCVSSGNSTLDDSQLDFMIKNILREFYYLPSDLPCVIRLNRMLFLMPIPANTHSRESILQRCQEGLTTFGPYFQDSFNFFVAPEAVPMKECAEEIRNLEVIARRNVNIRNQVFDLANPVNLASVAAIHPIPAEQWMDLLRMRQPKALLSSMLQYLANLQRTTPIYREQLVSYYYAVLHLLTTHLTECAPESVSFFHNELSRYGEAEVCSDFASLRDWTQAIVQLTNECRLTASTQDDAVKQVKDYISTHLSEDMSRDSLAGIVYLNPDYLSHLFKKETGFSLTNYIINERIRESKRLLSQTDMSIRDIAITCGFQNISYFSKQFKKATGITPREYRN